MSGVEGWTQRPSTILVVDDNRDSGWTIQAGLILAGYDVEFVESAEAALEFLDAGAHVDIVVAYIRMPDVDGFALVRIVRHRYPGVGVLLVSGHPWSADDVIPAGVTILRKPVPFGVLSDAIRVIRNSNPVRG